MRKKIKLCTFAIAFILSMAALTACKKKEFGAGQGANPPSAQSTSGANQGADPSGAQSTSGANQGADPSGAQGTSGANQGSADTASGFGNSVKGSKNGADQEGRGVIGGMMEDAQKSGQ